MERKKEEEEEIKAVWPLCTLLLNPKQTKENVQNRQSMQPVQTVNARSNGQRQRAVTDIYLIALESNNAAIQENGEESKIKLEKYLVFEDAVPGVEAGCRAGMWVIWCPHPGLSEVYKGCEEEVLAGLTGEHKEEEKTELEKEADDLKVDWLQGSGRPGEINDGWGEMLRTLEDFPYVKYGIRT